MKTADERYLAAAFPDNIRTLLRLCERDGDLREVCEDLSAMLQLAVQTHPDAAIQENLVELKQEIQRALASEGAEKTRKGNPE